MCSCIKEVNRHLAQKNTVLRIAEIFSLKTAHEGRGLVVATDKLVPRRSGRAVTITARHCPFCGDRLTQEMFA
jgi:hypothetical protein